MHVVAAAHDDVGAGGAGDLHQAEGIGAEAAAGEIDHAPPARREHAPDLVGRHVARVEQVVSRGALDRAVVDGPDIVEGQLGPERLGLPLRRMADVAEEMLVHERGPELVRRDGPEHGLHLASLGLTVGRWHRGSHRTLGRPRASMPQSADAVAASPPGAV